MLVSTTTEDAHSNYLKNRGEPGQWFQHKADYIEDKPAPRIRYEAFNIVEKNKPVMGEILVHDSDRVVNDDIHVRLTTIDAKKIADKFNFQKDKWFDFPGNMNYKPPKAPRKLYTETAKEIAENNWQYDSHDWYKHNGPQLASAPVKVNKCIGTYANEIRTKMRTSHADEWFKTCTNKGKPIIRTAPNSPKNRVKPEGLEYAVRAKGVGFELTRHNTQYDSEYDDSALPYRCVTSEAANNCRAQVKGIGMSRCLGTSSSRSTSSFQVHDRVKNDEAREYLSRSRSGTMNLAIEGSSIAVCKAKVRPEAEEYYLKSRGDMNSVIQQNNNNGYSSPKPAPRIRSEEAQKACEVNKGVMDSFLSKPDYRSAMYPPKYQVRAAFGPDAEEIVQKSNLGSMKQIINEYGKNNDVSQRKLLKSFTSEDGPENKIGVSDVLTHTSKRIQPEIPPLRISGAGFDILEKNRGGDFFKTLQQKPPTK